MFKRSLLALTVTAFYSSLFAAQPPHLSQAQPQQQPSSAAVATCMDHQTGDLCEFNDDKTGNSKNGSCHPVQPNGEGTLVCVPTH